MLTLSHIQHAANVSGRRVRSAPPVYIADEVAETVVGLVERPPAEVIVGCFGEIASRQVALEGGARAATLLVLGRHAASDETSPGKAFDFSRATLADSRQPAPARRWSRASARFQGVPRCRQRRGSDSHTAAELTANRQ